MFFLHYRNNYYSGDWATFHFKALREWIHQYDQVVYYGNTLSQVTKRMFVNLIRIAGSKLKYKLTAIKVTKLLHAILS